LRLASSGLIIEGSREHPAALLRFNLHRFETRIIEYLLSIGAMLMKRFISVLALAVLTTGAAHAARPSTTGPRTHASIPHDHSPKLHIRTLTAHK